jgi:uncharacterized membrane protein YcaP (DUF421 family)
MPLTNLRETNVRTFNQVIIVVLKTEGDFTVLHRSSAEGDGF